MSTISTRFFDKLYTALTMWEVKTQVEKDKQTGRIFIMQPRLRHRARRKAPRRNGWLDAVGLILVHSAFSFAGQILTN